MNPDEKCAITYPARLYCRYPGGLAWLVIVNACQSSPCQTGVAEMGFTGERWHGAAALRGMGALQRAAAGAGLLPCTGGAAGGGGGRGSVLAVSIRSDVAGLWRGYRRGGRGLAVHAGNMAQAWW